MTHGGTALADVRLRGRPWPLAVLTSRANVRQPMVYATMAALPASYFIILTLLAGAALGQHAILGAMVSYGVTGGVVSLPQTVVSYRTRRLHDMIVASPVRPLAYVIGLALSRLVYVAPPLVVVFVIFTLVSDVAWWRVVLLLPVIALAWFVGSVLGFVVARTSDNPASVSAIANMIGYLLVLLPPVYYPLALLPAWLQDVVLIVPTANIAQLLRLMAGLAEARPMIVIMQAVLLAATVVFCAWYASRDGRWREP